MATAIHGTQPPAGALQPEGALEEVESTTWLSAAPYLPATLLEGMCRHPQRPSWIDSVEGTLALADVSGFTRMSERLAELGREGAERLTNILNDFFTRLLDIASGYGGVNLKFGGDALLMLFTGDNHAVRGVATALAMQRATRQFATVRVGRDRIRLGMSVGIHSGAFWTATAGLPGRRMQYFILGPEASRVAEAEALASVGEVFITDGTLRMAGGVCQVEPRDDVYRVLRLSKRVVAEARAEVETAPLALPTRDLLAYLPPPVVSALQSDDQLIGIEGEHRKVSVLFVNVLGVERLLEEHGAATVLDELQRYVSAVVRLADRYGGFLAGNDIYTDGLKLILVFGAPVAREQDSANALRLALELNDELPRLDAHLSHRIGINSGFVFAGDVGSSYRREYTVMGDAVNLAARLMSSASVGQVLVSKHAAVEAGPSFDVGELAAIRVKGKKEPVEICVLEGEHAVAPIRAADEPGTLFGREAEIETLRLACRETEEGSGRSVVISGEAGIGKSRLALDFQNYLRAHGWKIHRGQCYAHTAANPFAPWIQLLDSFFDVGPEDSTKERTEKVLAAVKRLRPDLIETAPLLNALLALAIPQSVVTRSLDDETRRRRLFELVAALLLAAAADCPHAVVLEDLHRADNSSLQLISHVASSLESSHLLMCLTHRPLAGLKLELPADSTVTLALGELPEEDAVQLVRTMLDRPGLSAQVVEAILSKARGNPLFLEEVARSIRHSGALDQILSAPSSRAAEEMGAVEIPDRINALIMSRIDTLESTSKEILRSAAVIGSTFDLPTLRAALDPSLGQLPLEPRLEELTHLDFADREADPEEQRYRFKHAVIQEVAYESLSFVRRRELHGRVGSHLEEAHVEQLEPLYEVLLHHYSRSGDRPKTLTYAVKAGDKARQVFAHREAIEYYHRGLAVVEDRNGIGASQRSHLLERIGDSHELSGRYKDAARVLTQALRHWREATARPHAVPEVQLDLAKGVSAEARTAVLCQKIGVACERHSDYESSLKWLESALQALPARRPLLAAQIGIAKTESLFRKGLYEEAVSCGRKALILARRSGDSTELAYAHNILANPLQQLGRLKQAIRHRLAAVRLYEDTDDIHGSAGAHNDLGACYQEFGDPENALNHYEVALAAYERIGNLTRAAMVDNNMGEVLVIQGRPKEAQFRFLKAIERNEQAGESSSALTGYALVNLSRAYQREDRYEEAREGLERGIETLRTAGARGLVVEARLQRADLLLEMGQTKSALRTCRQVLRDARRLGRKLLETRGMCTLGRIALADKRFDEAEANLEQSAALAERLGANHDQALALLYLAEVYSAWPAKRDARRRSWLARRQARAIFRRLKMEMPEPA